MEVLHRRPAACSAAPITDLAALRSRGDTPALIVGDEVVTYTDLAAMINLRVATFGPTRRIVTLPHGNDVDVVVGYLAALCGGHVAHFSSDDDPTAMFEPGVQLHPDLAALASTSGSTGSAKLVRLSKANIDANAVAIADFLQLRSDDRAITSLPLHYCYGLSVLTSHLAVGASVVLTDTSVVDACFWELVERWRVTSLAGVPHTFDLLDRLDTDPLAGGSLRRVTQAGGRLAPERVLRYSESGRRNGWDFVVMYGQTEATARMAYLPADLAHEHPHTIGRPIAGGSFELAPLPAEEVRDEWRGAAGRGEVGEIVYRGPNVMLGYARCADDLRRGRDVDWLCTGDIGRRTAEGLYEIVGRRSRFVKLFGHRIDLDDVERLLADARVTGAVAGDDRLLAVAVTDAVPDAVRELLVRRLGVPAAAIGVARYQRIPVNANGKVDTAAILTAATAQRAAVETTSRSTSTATSTATLFADVLGAAEVRPDDTFTSLGGDSLSYVEASIRLEQLFGPLPANWHVMSVAALDAQPRAVVAGGWRRHVDHVETSVVIRAVGILLIVATHMRVARLTGGAHTLLAVAGYNFARFQLAATDVPGRLRRGLTTIARVAVPTSLWIGLQMAVVGGYSAGALFLVNNYFGSPWRRDGRWEYWYFEAFVQIFALLTLLFSLAPVRRLERRAPFAFASAGLVVATVLGLRLIEFGDSYNAIYRPHTVLLFVMLGWCAQKASRTGERVVVSVVMATAAPLYFDRWQHAAMVTALIALLVWLPHVVVPRRLVGLIGTLAAASMYIFLVHWQVWPMFTAWQPRLVAYICTVAVGVIVWAAVQRAHRAVHRRVSA